MDMVVVRWSLSGTGHHGCWVRAFMTRALMSLQPVAVLLIQRLL